MKKLMIAAAVLAFTGITALSAQEHNYSSAETVTMQDTTKKGKLPKDTTKTDTVKKDTTGKKQ